MVTRAGLQGGRRPSVLLIAHEVHDHGGMERAAAELIRRASASIDFTVVTSNLSPDLRDACRWARVRIPRRPLAARFPMFALEGSIVARRHDADIVHSIGVNTIGIRLDAITFQWCHAGARRAMGSLAPAGAPPVRRLNTRISKAMALAAERRAMCRHPLALAVSPGVAREVEREYPSTVTVLTPNGIDPTRFRPDPDARSELRADLAVADDRTVVLFLGGDWDRKGLATAIAGVGAAHRAGTDVELWVVGAGDAGRFTKVAEAVGLTDRIRFLGRRTDTERFYAAADLFVAPTEYETFSIAGYEAAACGVPVIATEVNGLEDLVGEDEQRGRFVRRGADDVERAVTELAADPEARRRIGDAAHDFASAFTWERSVDGVLAAYQRILAAPRRNRGRAADTP
jgi:glycosyltransferase involved in cell wall biosynthesis